MIGIDFVIAVRANQEHRSQSRPRQQRLEHIQRRRVGPLQVVEEDDQGMVWGGEGGQKAVKHKPESVACLGRPEGLRRELRAEDKLDLGNHLGNHASVRSERLGEPRSPPRDLLVALATELLKKLAKGGERPAWYGTLRAT